MEFFLGQARGLLVTSDIARDDHATAKIYPSVLICQNNSRNPTSNFIASKKYCVIFCINLDARQGGIRTQDVIAMSASYEKTS